MKSVYVVCLEKEMIASCIKDFPELVFEEEEEDEAIELAEEDGCDVFTVTLHEDGSHSCTGMLL